MCSVYFISVLINILVCFVCIRKNARIYSNSKSYLPNSRDPPENTSLSGDCGCKHVFASLSRYKVCIVRNNILKGAEVDNR